MRFINVLSFVCVLFFSCNKDPEIVVSDLPYGVSFTQGMIGIKVWSPDAESISLNLYQDCNSQEVKSQKALLKGKEGDWSIIIPDSLEGHAYDFTIVRNKEHSRLVVDPYVKSTCANGNRGAFVNISSTNPDGWASDKGPGSSDTSSIILYEVHVRDFSMDSSSKSNYPGKYLAFTEDSPYGLNHIAGLGVSHIHLLPVFDFASIDEINEPQKFNWGYDPQNYLVPEGSYSTSPNNPKSRILEFKRMVQSIHDKDLGVIMDVVYNHTYYLDNSSFQVWAPGYYYRQNEDGSYSNASACGNEVASESPKVRELIIESLKYWIEEYHIDGFRFDLMGIMDIPTMQRIDSELREIKPDIILYGEGWLAGNSPLPDSLRATKSNMAKIPGIAAFSDEIRDGIKGHWSDEKDKGFVSGKVGLKESVKFGIAGGVEHSQIDYSKVNNSNFAWAQNPRQLISYVSCHDNHTLIDKLEISAPEYGVEERQKMHLLAQSIVLTSQGIPFLHAGTEFFRTKFGEHNSFESPDSINQIPWHQIENNPEPISYIRSLIEFRKSIPAFRLQSQTEVNEHINFISTEDSNSLAFELNDPRSDQRVLCVFIPVGSEMDIEIPNGNWNVAFDGFQKQNGEKLSEYDVNPIGPNALILVE